MLKGLENLHGSEFIEMKKAVPLSTDGLIGQANVV